MDPSIEQVLNDPAASDWLKSALRSALERDCIDAATDAAALANLLSDRASYHPVRLLRSLAALRHSPFLTRAVFRRLNDYTRVGFHPDDVDNTALLERWTAELFGEHGSLVDHLQ